MVRFVNPLELIVNRTNGVCFCVTFYWTFPEVVTNCKDYCKECREVDTQGGRYTPICTILDGSINGNLSFRIVNAIDS